MASEDTENRRSRGNQDMILAPNEYALIRDDTKGEVSTYVGPNKTSLAGSDCPVVLDTKTHRFRGVELSQAIQAFQTAAEGSYVVLENPAESDKHPTGQGKLTAPNLRFGKKVNISGPAVFALWPGQSAKVLSGHNLRSNEYLICRVYDEEAARTNWENAVIKTQNDPTIDPNNQGDNQDKPAKGKATTAAKEAKETKQASTDIPSANDLTMGKLFVVRGTEVSFYIPPTGIEVVPEHVNGEDRYVREAVTLERLEYCLLLDQNGNKRYVKGPAVVFPRPTEKFVEAPIKSNPDKVKAKKFRAQELTPTSGIHIRVIADYTDEATSKTYKAGDELFITGSEQPVYFPREEHAIIKYGEQDVHYGIAIPSGEARYVLDRNTGVIDLVTGPRIFLPDPRSQVIAQRALPLNLCELLYPGNQDALAINADRLGIEEQDIMGVGGANAAFLNSSYVRSATEDEAYGAVAAVATPDAGRGRILIKSASKSLPGDAFDRKAKYTAPRSVILNTKYDGAVTTTIWTGYAMLLIRKSGERRIVQGPGTFMLEYDESPQVITLSTGKPKNLDNPYKTVFLQTTANMVSDIVEVETRDFCRLNVKLSYRVNFEGDDTAKWFAVDNYVKFMCDHMRSKIRNAVQKIGIEEFYGNYSSILRDIVLGTSSGEGKPRAGTGFTENNMRIYDVEILDVKMQNNDIEKMLVSTQREVITGTLQLAGEKRKLDYTKAIEDIKRQVAETVAVTRRFQMDLQADEAQRKMVLDLTLIESTAKTDQEKIAKEREANEARAINALAQEKAAADVAAVDRETKAKDDEQQLEHQSQQQALELQKLKAQAEALVQKAGAITPDLIAALAAFGDKAMIEKLAEAMAPMAILGGGSVVDIAKKLLDGTAVAKHLEPVTNGTGTKGKGKQSQLSD